MATSECPHTRHVGTVALPHCQFTCVKNRTVSSKPHVKYESWLSYVTIREQLGKRTNRDWPDFGDRRITIQSLPVTSPCIGYKIRYSSLGCCCSGCALYLSAGQLCRLPVEKTGVWCGYLIADCRLRELELLATLCAVVSLACRQRIVGEVESIKREILTEICNM